MLEVIQAGLLRRSHLDGLLKGLRMEVLRLERLLLEGLLREGLLLAGLRWTPALWLAELLLVGRKQASQRLEVLVERLLKRLMVEAEHLVLQVLERLRQGREVLLLLMLLHQGRVGEAGRLLGGLPERSRGHCRL